MDDVRHFWVVPLCLLRLMTVNHILQSINRTV